MNDYARLRLQLAATRGMRSPHLHRPRGRRRWASTQQAPAALARLASSVKALASAACA